MNIQQRLVKEIAVRFIMGGLAVVMCYVVSVYSPVKFIGGVFAAFPAVMGAAIMLSGIQDGSKEAAEVAKGAVSGMIGCTACVLAALYMIKYLNSWILGLFGAVIVWFFVSTACNIVFSHKKAVPSSGKSQ